jgi:acetamidase/formamidase
LDNKDLVAGTTLFLPVHTAGGLLSIGDGHAAQGDGEVTGTAIETSLAGTVQVILHRDRTLEWPRAETPTHYMSMGLDHDLDEAARLATQEMVDFLVRNRGMDAGDAYVLCSVALDLRITQLVDGTKGVHGMLAKSLFR